MLEALLILACLNPSNDSCGKTTEAYGSQTGLNKIIEDYGKKNPTISFVVGSIGLARSKHLYYQVIGPFYHDVNTESQTLWFKKDF